MRFEFTFLRKKFARRILMLFVICALIPITGLTILSFNQVTNQLEQQSQRRRHQASKAIGMEIFEHLLFLDLEMKGLAKDIFQSADGTNASYVELITQKHKAQFKNMAVVTNDGSAVPLIGKINSLPAKPTNTEIQHLRSGKTVISNQKDSADHTTHLFMRIAIDPKHPEQGILLGEIDRPYLWGKLEGYSLPLMTELTILDETDHVLFSTIPVSPSFPKQLLRSGDISGQFDWEKEGTSFRSNYWSVFLKAGFFTPKWTVILSESRDNVFAPMTNFKRYFILIVLLSVGIVIIISITQIRRSLLPLESLQEGTQQIADRNFDSRVTITSGDEFESLAESFNTMAEQLGTQFKELGDINEELKEEIIERKKSKEVIQHMAYHDHLTGLPNRLLLIDRFNYILAEAKRYNKLGAVIFLDLDDFKFINDTMGHAEGDELLKAMAKRLNDLVRASDTLARHGGDEFTILIQDLKKINNITKVVNGIFSKFEEPFFLKGHEFFITTSMGISIFPDDGLDADELLKNADIAMYKAKERGKNTYQLFDPTMNEKALERVMLESKLRRAIEKDEFLLNYQPQIDIYTGETVGLEALLRWNEKELGLISPGQFIPLAEDTGLIVPIGEWVLHTACLQNRLWQDKGLRPVNMAVNVSLRQFKQNDFVDNVKRVLADTNLNPQYLELEITESSIMEDVESNIGLLRELKSFGLKLSIDDFGTGYSSFEYLKRLPVDFLKIDLSFVRDITSNPDDAAIAKAIIQVAHTLRLEVVAEGVETIEQFRLLNSLQCDKIQGYLVSKPLPQSAEIERFIKEAWHLPDDQLHDESQNQSNIVS